MAPTPLADIDIPRALELYGQGRTWQQVADDLEVKRSTLHERVMKHADAGSLARARESAGEAHAELGLRILEDVNPEGKHARNALLKATKLSDYRRWLAGCLSEAFADRSRVDVKAQVMSLQVFADMRTASLAALEASTTVGSETPELQAPEQPAALPHVVAPDEVSD